MATATDTDSPVDFHLRWSALGAPQRPTAGVVAAMRPFVATRPGPALQLGVTPEIARLSRRGVAIDWNPEMLRIAWPGDSATHRAMLGDWLALPLGDASVDTVFGDGSLTMLRWPDHYALLLDQLARVLRPGGRIVLRCFARPEDCETIEDVVADTLAGRQSCYGEFKLRFNMAIVRDTGAVSIESGMIHRLFERHFPDRLALARATRWTAAEFGNFDAYADRPSLHAYPSRAEIAATLPAGCAHRFVETGGYPLAERCPLLIVDFPRG